MATCKECLHVKMCWLLQTYGGTGNAAPCNEFKDRSRFEEDAQKWIPVTERLPFVEYGESDDVLAITELGVIRTLYFDGGNWCFQNGECCPHKVTHWMPLPEPPKEVE